MTTRLRQEPDPSEVLVEVISERMDSGYWLCPNDLFRGEGIYDGLNTDERCYLGSLLSHQHGYQTTQARLERCIEHLGRNKRESVRRTLRERGFLSIKRSNDGVSKTGKKGVFRYRYRAYLMPLPIEERDRLPAKKSMPLNSGLGDLLEEVAGQSMPLHPGSGYSGHGHPGPGQDSADPLYKKEHRENHQPPTLLDHLQEVPAEPEAVDDKTPPEPEALAEHVLNDVLTAARMPNLERPRGRARTNLIQKLSTRIRQGWNPDDLAAALSGSYAGADRIIAVLHARIDDLGSEPPVRAAPRPRTPCAAHPGQSAAACTICDAAADSVLLAEPMEGADARAQIRQINEARIARLRAGRQSRTGTA